MGASGKKSKAKNSAAWRRTASARSHERAVATALLRWYDRARRDLPWRARPGEQPDPYRVWLSEIMLQQTTVATVGSYFGRFIARWPTVHHLAAASLDDVLHAWQGLGYYARARNLHRCARIVSGALGGRFPDTEEALARLPGIGPYTAAAVAAIAFGRKATVVDGNVERVVARLFAVEEPLPGAKPALRRFAARLTPECRAGDFAQAIMDLGATVCTPRAPRCLACPLATRCRAFASGLAAVLPRRTRKRARPTRHAIVFWCERPDGAVLLRRREEKGLLGGLMEFPSSPWVEMPPALDRLDGQTAGAPAEAVWTPLPARVNHGFTHFQLELAIVKGRVDARTAARLAAAGGVWCPPGDFGRYALSTLMRKVAHAVSAASAGFRWDSDI